MKRLLTFLIIIAFIAAPVHGDLISDLFGWLTGSSDKLNTTPSDWPDGSITSLSESSEGYHFEYTANNSATLNLYCKDSVGYFVNVWGASIVNGSGQYDILKTDKLGQTSGDCRAQIDSDDEGTI